ncbi:unnamed protein product, partial [Prorocentrum cordatum]
MWVPALGLAGAAAPEGAAPCEGDEHCESPVLLLQSKHQLGVQGLKTAKAGGPRPEEAQPQQPLEEPARRWREHSQIQQEQRLRQRPGKRAVSAPRPWNKVSPEGTHRPGRRASWNEAPREAGLVCGMAERLAHPYFCSSLC